MKLSMLWSQKLLIDLKAASQKSNQDGLVLTKPRWIGPDETMSLLHIKSDTTLQKLRDEGKIRFTQPQKKIILYDRDSVMKYLESHARNTF